MTPHVAEAGEGRGRVILRFSAWSPSDAAIEAALLVARAFQSEIEVLLVEDAQRANFAGFPFAVEFSLRDGRPRRVTPRTVQAEMRGGFTLLRKRLAYIADDGDVRIYEHVVRDDPIQALVSACARRGPWNMVVLGETFHTAAAATLDEIFESVSDATGVVIAGPIARSRSSVKPKLPQRQPSSAPDSRYASQRTQQKSAVPSPGPVVMALEDTERLPAMLRVARMMAKTLETTALVLLVAATHEEIDSMEAQVRLALAGSTDVELARSSLCYGDAGATVEAIRRINASFLLVQYGGIAASDGRQIRRLVDTIECPVLLVR